MMENLQNKPAITRHEWHRALRLTLSEVFGITVLSFAILCFLLLFFVGLSIALNPGQNLDTTVLSLTKTLWGKNGFAIVLMGVFFVRLAVWGFSSKRVSGGSK